MTPDLSILGKVIGGGLPAAAYAGRRELMERIAPAGDVYQAGTLSGNPLATAAGLTTLGLLDGDAYARLDRLTAQLADGLRDAAAGLPVQVCHTTGLLTVFFSEEPVRDYEDAKRCDTERYAAFCRAMLDRGVYLPPSQFEAWFPSLAHTDAHVERTIEAAREALAARDGPGRDRRRGRPVAGAVRRCRSPGRSASTARSATACSCSRRSTRATCCTTASRGCSRAWTPTCGCSPATPCTRSAWRAWRSSGDLPAVASCPT